jgi:hypothetical protein
MNEKTNASLGVLSTKGIKPDSQGDFLILSWIIKLQIIVKYIFSWQRLIRRRGSLLFV